MDAKDIPNARVKKNPGDGMLQCPHCKFEQKGVNQSWHEYIGFPFICQKCEQMFWIEGEYAEVKVGVAPKMEEKIPSLEEGAPIYLDNKEHNFHLCPGTVVQRDHVHYKVELFYHVELSKHNGRKTYRTRLWVPEAWVKPVPEFMKRRKGK